jgi:trans-2,3-dihydro-3-hydroxyanthranilate isomerase
MVRFLHYTHVDVFSSTPFAGNSLPVFQDASDLTAKQMLAITREMRHYEAIFLEPLGHPDRVHARVFDLFGELPFAGHPLIGAAGVLDHASSSDGSKTWWFEMQDKTVSITTERTPRGLFGMLDQGEPEFLRGVLRLNDFVAAFELHTSDLLKDLPVEVVSMGLRYLIMPVRSDALARARPRRDITEPLRAVGADFAVLHDEENLEIRHWNNDGVLEDAATGSAAGTIGAYRLKHGLARAGESFVLTQGRFLGRPSRLWVEPRGTPEAVTTVRVGGDVCLVGHGTLEVMP